MCRSRERERQSLTLQSPAQRPAPGLRSPEALEHVSRQGIRRLPHPDWDSGQAMGDDAISLSDPVHLLTFCTQPKIYSG